MAALLGCLASAPAVDAAGAGLGSSGYLGGSHHEAINDVAVDAAGNVYVKGWTQSSDFPVRGALLELARAGRYRLQAPAIRRGGIACRGAGSRVPRAH